MLDIVGRPEHLIVTHMAVPPVAIRPSVEMDGASNEDDITMKLMVRVWGPVQASVLVRQELCLRLWLVGFWEGQGVVCGHQARCGDGRRQR